MRSSALRPGAGIAVAGSPVRLAALACAVVLLLLVGAGASFAHGGPPLRLGVTADPALSSVARLVLVHLREGVGFAVDWRAFPDEGALRAAFAAGKLDIAIGQTDGGRAPDQLRVEAACPGAALAALAAALRGRWGAEAFLLELPPGPTACARPAVIVSRAVLEDLRFGILRKEIGRVAAFITREDLAAVVSAAERGGERAATAAARAALAAKAKR